MKNSKKYLLLVVLSSFSLLISTRVAYYLSEKVFFDNFYYQKSTVYGYWIKSDKPLTHRDFGKRGEDMINLLEHLWGQKKVLGIQNENEIYTIAIIGDSYVWGQGLKNEDRFPVVLEKMLNRIRPTRVYSLGNSGDSILDNYIKYKEFLRNHKVNLSVFGIVDNDLLIREVNLYDNNFQNALITKCEKPIIYDPDSTKTSPGEYARAVRESFDLRNGNYCIFVESIKNIPKENVLFFNYGNNFGAVGLLENYIYELSVAGFKILSTPFMNEAQLLHVSKTDTHPSAYANKIFADTLYKEIIRVWGQQ